MLKKRLQELIERRKELEKPQAPSRPGEPERSSTYTREFIISPEEIDAMPPEDISNVPDVEMAIEMTYHKIYGVYEPIYFICAGNYDEHKCKDTIQLDTSGTEKRVFSAA